MLPRAVFSMYLVGVELGDVVLTFHGTKLYPLLLVGANLSKATRLAYGFPQCHSLKNAKRKT